MEKVNDAAKATTKEYPVAALGLIIVLLLLVIYLWVSRPQGFMPSTTLRFQRLDGLGFERMEGAADGKAKKPERGWWDTPAERVLNSPEFGCDTRKPAGDEAWGWMFNQSTTAESAVGGRPKSEADFTRILAGQ